MTTTATTPAWRGWFRANRQCTWACLAEGDTYSETLDRLLDALASMKGGESVVLRGGAHPDGPPHNRSRRRF
jgi:hypothetical protein